jgi:hypothetical protein
MSTEAQKLGEQIKTTARNYGGIRVSDAITEKVDRLVALASSQQERKGLEKAAREVLNWVEVSHRPPRRDALETGRMVLVRLHALADLHEALGDGEQAQEGRGDPMQFGWPYVEHLWALSDRLERAYNEKEDMLAALKHVLVTRPPMLLEKPKAFPKEFS